MFFFCHNSQWKIGSDLSLYRQADTYKAHTSMWFPSFKGNDFYFFEEKNKHKKIMHSYKPKNNKTICTSLLWRWIKGKRLNILCSVTSDCKAILTLLTTSLRYSTAVHILTLRALEKTIQMISYLKRNTSLDSIYHNEEGDSCAVDRRRSLKREVLISTYVSVH